MLKIDHGSIRNVQNLFDNVCLLFGHIDNWAKTWFNLKFEKTMNFCNFQKFLKNMFKFKSNFKIRQKKQT